MGIFDELKKLTKDIGKEIKESGIQENISQFGKEFKDSMNELGKDAKDFLGNINVDSTSNESQNADKSKDNKGIPEIFNEFPRFGKEFKDCIQKETDQYIRFSMIFKKTTKEEIQNYIDQIQIAGFMKATDVRYEKGRYYIIVDPAHEDGLNIVYHIKK